MLAPSETQMQPLSVSVFASSPVSSFCVAHGRATSHFTNQGLATRRYSQRNLSAYSLTRPRRMFLSSIKYSHFSPLMPSLSTIVPSESEIVTTLPPSWLTFSMAYCDTLPEPDTVTVLPSKDMLRVF